MSNVEVLFVIFTVFTLVLFIIGYALIREISDNIKILNEEIQNKVDLKNIEKLGITDWEVVNGLIKQIEENYSKKQNQNDKEN